MSISDHLHQPIKALGGLELHYVGDIAVIVMNCGENRLNTPFLDNFNKLMDDVERNHTCKGLITTGKGKFYSNGLDLAWLVTLKSAEPSQEFFYKITTWLMRLLLFPLPTLAALNGHAFAGGALLAFAHDLRVMNTDKGWLCFNEIFIKRQFQPSNLLYMRTKMGSGPSYTDAVVLGKRYTAPEALDNGLVHATPSTPLLLSESIQLLKSFYGKSGFPRESLHLMKCDVYSDVTEQYKKDIAAFDKNKVKSGTANMQSKL